MHDAATRVTPSFLPAVKQRHLSGTSDDRASPEIITSSQSTSPGPLRERNGESLLNVESATVSRVGSSYLLILHLFINTHR